MRLTKVKALLILWLNITLFVSFPKLLNAAVQTGVWYRIEACHSGKVLEVANQSTADGANVQQWSYNGGAHQQWRIADAGNGYYSIENRNSGKVLDVWEVSTVDGANVVQWPYWGGEGQQWKINDVGNGRYSIEARHSGKVLDVWEVSTADGANVVQWPYWGGEGQQWRFIEVGAVTPTPTPTSVTPTPTPNVGVIYQAEDAYIYHGVVANNHSGYTGTGFVDYTNETGSFLEWTVHMAQSGNQTLTFRYANGTSTNRTLDIYVNGSRVISNLAFNGTGAWNNWSTQTATVYLNAGSNTIRAIATTSNGGPNIDYLQVTGEAGQPTPTPVPSSTPVTEGKRQMERLDRGVVAVKVSNGVFVSWRMLGNEPAEVSYNLYRGSTKVNSAPITGATNYVDRNGTTGSTYTVRAIINGVEQGPSPAANVWSNNYWQIPLQVPAGGRTPDGVSYTYSANDCSVGDLNGDGNYEIVVKWDPSNSKDNSQSGYTGNVYLDAYTLTGTRLWRIDLGKNIRAGAHYTQFLVYDLDGDGDAEVVCKTADGTIDGTGKVIGNANADYRNSSGYVLEGPEYLTIFSGASGRAMETVNYLPARGRVSDWGDSYGNRVDRFLACIAYLDGKRPSIVMCRGYYTRSVLVAWDYRDGQLTRRWTFDSNNGYSSYAGQGCHSLSVADVDNDGKDEIIYGACAIDDDGRGLYNTGLKHGDALHVSDFDPDRPGLEVWQCHENSPYGATFRDARTGSIIFRYTASSDTGRACVGDITANHRGCEVWASNGVPLASCKGQNLGSHSLPINFMIWWDGDLLRELLDGTTISKYGGGTLLSASGCSSNNGTKANPCLTADILGDWREEAIWRTSDSRYLRIYTTTATTSHRIYTLMHDPVYRLSIAWQNVAYNQPPHTGFYLGEGMAEPPRPDIYLTP